MIKPIITPHPNKSQQIENFESITSLPSQKIGTRFRNLVSNTTDYLHKHADRQPRIWVADDGNAGDCNNGLAVALELSPYHTELLESGPTIVNLPVKGQSSIEVHLRKPDQSIQHTAYQNIDFKDLPDIHINSTIFETHLNIRGVSGVAGRYELNSKGEPLADKPLTFDNTFSVYMPPPDVIPSAYRWIPETDLNIVFRHQLPHLPENIPNQLVIDTVPSRVNAASLDKAKRKWGTQLSAIQQAKPVYMVIIGERIDGNEELSVQDAKHLAHEVIGAIKKTGGSVVVTSSRRTKNVPQILGTFSEELADTDIPAYCYDYSKGTPANNPYMGLLAIADRVVVTDDSMSMQSDAAASGKPVFLFNRLPAAPLKEGEKPPEKMGHKEYNDIMLQKKMVLPIDQLSNPEAKTECYNSTKIIADAIRQKMALDKNMNNLLQSKAPSGSINRFIPKPFNNGQIER